MVSACSATSFGGFARRRPPSSPPPSSEPASFSQTRRTSRLTRSPRPTLARTKRSRAQSRSWSVSLLPTRAETHLAGVVGAKSAPTTKWERPVARRFVLRPNRLLRDLALEIELDHKHVCLLPRLFPNLERLHLHGYTDSRESLDVAVETLLGGLPRLASLTLGDECRGDSERGDSALPLPRHMTELRVLSSDIEWDYLREIDEPKDDRDDRAFRLCLAADLHPNFTALRLENSHTARLLSPSAPSMSLPAPGVSAWPPLRCLGLSGGTLMPGVALVDLLRIPTLEHVALSHMNLYPNKAWIGFSSVATTGEGVCDGGGGGGDGGDDDGGGVGGDDDGGDKALAVAVSVETSAVGVVGCRRLDLHNCALSRTAMRNLLRLYPRLAEVRILFLPRYPQCTSAAEFASAESEARPIGVDDILEAIADTAALRDGHLAYVHLPMTSGLAVFGPPTTDGYGGDGDSDGPGGDGAQVGAGIAKRDANISESGDRRSGPTGGDGPTFAAAPDDRDRPQCRCRTKCVSCACVHAEVVCGDACHGAVSEIAIAPRAVSGATPSKSKKAAGSATPRQAIRAAAVAIGGWPCRNKVRGERPPSVGATIAAEAAVAPVFVAHNRLAVQCRVLAIECPGAARARFSPTSLIVLPTSARAENDEATTTTPPPMKAPTPSGKRRDASRSLGTQSSSPSQFSLAQHVCIEPLLVAGLHGADPTVARFARFDASLYLPALARIVASASTMRRARGGAPCIVQFSEPGEHHSSWHRALEPYSAFNGVAPRLEFRQHCGRQPDGVGNKEDGDSGGGIDRLNVGERPRETSGVYSNACLCGVPVRGWTQSVSAPVKSATPTKKSTRPSSSSAAAAPPSVSARVTSPDQLVCGATHFVDLALYRADNFYA